MRIARKLFLLAAMALTAMAFAASSASAQTPVEVMSEPGGHCSAAAPATCEVHVASEGPVGLFVSSEEVFGDHEERLNSLCTNEFNAEVYEDGSGEIHDQVLAGAGCINTVPCNAATGHNTEWPLLIQEVGGAEHALVNFCVVTSLQQPIECTVEVAITKTALHDYELRTDPSGNQRAECADPVILFYPPHGVFTEFNFGVQGIWHIEGTSIELEHP